MKQQIRVMLTGGAAFALVSCQTFPHLFDSSMEPATRDAKVENVTVTPAAVISSADPDADEPRVSALKADNARLQRQLAAALKQNAKLKRDLSELKDDNSLLKDLAAKKQR